MSTTIDERVVEMRFDNKHFEQNVRTSMSTLERLKQSLKLTGASKGLENLNAATKKVDFSRMEYAATQAGFQVQDVWLKVASVFEYQIARRIINTAERMTKALTIEPITTGFQEYETQINATQTILANTASKGSDINDVNKALEELNKYADKTIYNFTEMTRNIGTFTAAGIDLDTSVNAIQGIANLAAVSGSTSQQASTAMYQLSQALASGTVKLMDWNSVVNAGMGGEMFQNALKKTSEELGTGAEAAIKASGSFRESLRDGWLTSEVLTETLKKFTTSGANEYIAEYTGLTLESVQAETKKIASAKDSKKAIDEVAESLAKASGKSKDEIKSALEFAQNAEDAATKVKTFTQLWDVLKESAQSGWSQTWKLIVGDFEEAKGLLTPLADFLTGMLNSFSDARNAVLELALDNPFTRLMDKISAVTETTEKMVDVTKNYGEIVDKVIGGDYGNGQSRWDKLTEEGYDWAKVQNMVNEKLGSSVRHTEQLTEAQKEQNKTQSTTIDQLAEMSDYQLKELGFTQAEIDSLRELQKIADATGLSLSEIFEDQNKIDGRTLLINSFKNAGQGLVAVLKAIGDAWSATFEPITALDLYNAIAGLHKFSTYLRVNDETADKWRRTFEGVFALLDIFTTLVGGGVKIAFKILTEVLSYFDMDILDLTANIGDMIVGFRDWLDSIFDISGALDIIVPAISTGVETVKKWISEFKQLPVVQKIITAIKEAFAKLKELDIAEIGGNILDVLIPALTNAASAVKGWVKAFTEIPVVAKAISKIKEALSQFKGMNFREIGQFLFDGLYNGLGDGAKKVVDKIIEVAKNLITKFCDILGIHSPSTVMIGIGGFIIAGLIAGLASGLISVPETLRNIANKCVEVLKNIDFGSVFAVLLTGGIVLSIFNFSSALKNLSKSLSDFSGGFTKVTDALAGTLKSFSMSIKAKAIKDIAIAIAILAASVLALTLVDDPKKLWNAVGIITVLALIVGGLAVATHLLSKSSASIGKDGIQVSNLTSGLIGIGLALLAVAAAIKLVGGMEPEEYARGLKAVAGIFVGFVAIMGAFALMSKFANKSTESMDKLGDMLVKLSVAMLLMIGVVKLAGGLNENEMIKGAGFVAAFTIFVLAISAITKLAGASNRIEKLGGMILKLSVAMMLMVGVVKLAGTLTIDEMKNGAIFAGAFVVFVGLLVAITQIGKDKEIAKLGGLLMAISASMLIMIGVCKLAGKLTLKEMIAGGAFLLAFVGVVALLVKVGKIGKKEQMVKLAGTLIAMATAIAILAGVTILLGLVDPKKLAKGIIAVGLLTAFMAGLIFVTKYAKDCKANLIVMSVAIGLLTTSVVILSTIKPEKLWGAVAAMGLLMGIFAGVLAVTQFAKNCIGNLIVMTVAIGLIGYVIYQLAKMPVDSVLGSAKAISILLLTMTGAMVLASLVGPTALIAVGALALMGLVVGELALILGLMSKFNVEPSINTAIALSILLGAMSASLVILSVVGLMGPAALIGVVSLLGLVTGLAALVVGVGALVKKFPQIQEFIDTGIPILEQLASGIGSMIGRFIGGIGEGIGDSLVNIGNDIADFMQSLVDASDIASGIDGSSFDGLGQLVKALIAVGLTSVGMSIADMFTNLIGEQTAMEKFESDGVAFFKALKAMSEEMTGYTFPADFSADGIVSLIKAMGAVALASVGSSIADVFTNLIGDQTAMEKFQADGIAFFKAIKEISKEMTGFTFPEDFSVEGLTTMLDALKSVNNTMIGSSIADMFTKLVGDQTAMEKFQADGVAFFKAIKAISTEMTGFTFPEDFSVEGLTTMLDALKSVNNTMIGSSIADMFTKIVGDQTAMEKFQADGVAFFKAIKAISTEMTGFVLPEDFSSENITTILDTLKSVGDYSTGATWDDIFTLGGTSMEKFQSDGVSLFQALKTISTEASGISTESITTAKSALDEIKTIIESTNGIDYTGVEAFTGIGSGGIGADGPMHDIAVAITDFSDTVSGINTEAVNTSITAANKIKTLIASLVTLDTSGIANFKAGDIGTSMKDYADKVAGIDDTVVASSITSANRLVTLIRTLVGLDTSGVALFNVGPIGENIKSYSSSVSGIDSASISTSITAAHNLKNLINSLATINTTGVASFQTALNDLGNVNYNGFVQAFTASAAQLPTIGGTLIDGLVNGIKSKTGAITSAGKDLAGGMLKGISSQKSAAKSSVNSLLLSVVTSIRSKYTSFYGAGSYLVDGFSAGISANAFKAEAQAVAMAEAALEAAREALGIASPSKEFFKIGDFAGQGFVNALGEFGRMSYNAGSEMADYAKSGLNDSISKIRDVINGDLDTQPTIRPVLDLSNVRSGASSINGLFGSGVSMDLMTNVGAINSAMNQRIQNGSNGDVVGAINNLRKDLGNIGGPSYVINGVTYDDGSNISTAVESIVRAARMERRV